MMRDLFPGFYQRTDDELSSLWQQGIFVFDTNMLLHVYEYSPDTRVRFFETLSRLQERIWIPYQVAFEYQRRRMKVIIRQKDSYKSASKQLDRALQFLKDNLEPYRKDKHAFIDTEELISKVTQEIANTRTEIQKAGSKHPDYKNRDPLRENLDELFTGRVGSPYDKETSKKKYEEAQYRLENEIPPGFEDNNKDSLDRYGDIIVWFQLIDFASSKKKPLIFVTDDVKKDWWIPQEESYGIRRPRPELIQEMYLETGMLFHMYEGFSFMDEAQQFLKLEAKPEVIEEIKEIGQQDTETFNQVKHGLTKRPISIYSHVENIVLEWLQSTYSQCEIVKNIYHHSPDFFIIEPDGTRIGAELKYKLGGRYTMSDIAGLFGLVNIRREEPLDKLMIILVCGRDDVDTLTKKIQESLDIPPNISLIIGGYLPDGQFSAFAMLP